jgi:hypothetical protein
LGLSKWTQSQVVGGGLGGDNLKWAQPQVVHPQAKCPCEIHVLNFIISLTSGYIMGPWGGRGALCLREIP